jgi:hypothetical protein
LGGETNLAALAQSEDDLGPLLTELAGAITRAVGHYVPVESVRAAAKRHKILRKDQHGRQRVSRADADLMTRNYVANGHFLPRKRYAPWSGDAA